MSELVTGEAVALELRPAKLPSRAMALLLDLAAAVTVYLIVTIALVAATSSLDDAAQTALSITSFVLVLVGGPIAVETLTHGRSLGKMACGLRVVRDDGGPIRFRHALVRGLIGVIEILLTFGAGACIASLVSARGRRVGDVFAGTLVVRERVPVTPAAYVPPPPPWLAGRFAELDLSAVPDGLWLAVRQYLTRMGQLDGQVRHSMAERLASDVAARTGTPPPYGVPAPAYLSAVLHERQAREARRAFGSGAPAGATAAGAPGPWAAGPWAAGPSPVTPMAPVTTPPMRLPSTAPVLPSSLTAPVAPPAAPAVAPPASSPASSPAPPPAGGSSGEGREASAGGGAGTGFVPPA